MQLSPVAQRFILHWGTMGSRWGINRTVAQIHALLFLESRPLPAETIAESLGVARSNVSTSLKELLSWQLIRSAPVLGDRRDHFESVGDVWEMFRIVVDERKRRELDPTIQLLQECVEELEGAQGEATTRERLTEMLEFFESTTTWYGELRRLPTGAIRRLMKVGTKIGALVEGIGGGTVE